MAITRKPAFLRQSLTCDRGCEMARHAELTVRLNIDIWFADPYASSAPQFLPKGTHRSPASQTMLNDITRLLNGRPRKTLDWRTPEEAMAEESANVSNRVALGS